MRVEGGSVLTVLLKDPGDGFVHMLLQFGSVNAEVALEGKQTNSLCKGSLKLRNRARCSPVEPQGGRCLCAYSDICRLRVEKAQTFLGNQSG